MVGCLGEEDGGGVRVEEKYVRKTYVAITVYLRIILKPSFEKN